MIPHTTPSLRPQHLGNLCSYCPAKNIARNRVLESDNQHHCEFFATEEALRTAWRPDFYPYVNFMFFVVP